METHPNKGSYCLKWLKFCLVHFLTSTSTLGCRSTYSQDSSILPTVFHTSAPLYVHLHVSIFAYICIALPPRFFVPHSSFEFVFISLTSQARTQFPCRMSCGSPPSQRYTRFEEARVFYIIRLRNQEAASSPLPDFAYFPLQSVLTILTALNPLFENWR